MLVVSNANLLLKCVTAELFVPKSIKNHTVFVFKTTNGSIFIQYGMRLTIFQPKNLSEIVPYSKKIGYLCIRN